MVRTKEEIAADIRSTVLPLLETNRAIQGGSTAIQDMLASTVINANGAADDLLEGLELSLVAQELRDATVYLDTMRDSVQAVADALRGDAGTIDLKLEALADDIEALAGGGDPVYDFPSSVVPFAETPALTVGSGDDADDAAIHGDGWIIGTSKHPDGGLEVYAASDGSRVQWLQLGMTNNVDVRGNVVVSTNRSHNRVDVLSIDPSNGSLMVTKSIATPWEPYGIAFFKDTFVVTREDAFGARQYDLQGNLLAELSGPPTNCEGVLGCDSKNAVYITEELGGLWKFTTTDGRKLSGTGTEVLSRTALNAAGDLEGITEAKGHLIISSQGDSSYILVKDDAFVHKFKVVAGNGIDSVGQGDGLAANDTLGLLVFHDGEITGKSSSNYKLVRMDDLFVLSGSEPTPDPTPMDRFVDPGDQNASDENDGSESAPWATLTKAGQAARPGETVWVQPGIYTEGLRIHVSGKPDARVVFRAATEGGTVVLQGKGVEIRGQSHVVVDGFRIDECMGVGDQDSRGIVVRGIENGPVVADIVVRNCHVDHCFSSAISVWGVSWQRDPGDFRRIDGIIIEDNLIERANDGGHNEQITLANGVQNFEIRRNVIRNGGSGANGGEGIDIKEGCAHGSIHHNVVHDIQRRAYYIDGGGRSEFKAPTHDILVYSNIAHDVVNGFAIMSEGGEDVYNVDVYNNLFYNITDDGAFLFDHPNAAANPGQFHDISFVNNTFWKCGRSGLDLNTTEITGGVVVRNNILTSYRDRNNAASASHNITATPGFVDESADDYHLADGSPAVDAGTSDGAPNEDIEGTARPQGQGIDIGCYEFVAGPEPGGGRQSSVSQYGITWTFDKEYPVGQFVNGDWWVVGNPVKVISITPEWTGEFNGAVLNPKPGGLSGSDPDRRQGYDSRIPNVTYDAAINAALPGGSPMSASNPLEITPVSSLVSQVGQDPVGSNAASSTYQRWTDLYAVLTVLSSVPPQGSFRPSYIGPHNGFVKEVKYNVSQLDYGSLASLDPVPGTPSLSDVTSGTAPYTFKKPLVDYIGAWSGEQYFWGAQNCRWGSGGQQSGHLCLGYGTLTLMLQLDFANEEKQEALIQAVQIGIDYAGVLAASDSALWLGEGGFGKGRYWPILFAGKVLGDSSMTSLATSKSDIWFGENCTTFYVPQSHVDNNVDSYEQKHVGMPEWGIRHCFRPDEDDVSLSAPYRQCCNMKRWSGMILSARIMGLKSTWGHDALFDYADRWHNDSLGGVEPQFHEDMWDAYRSSAGEPTQPTPPPASGDMASSVSQYGITWTFDKEYRVGRFVNGDWWVVGPTKIVGFSPEAVTSPRHMNGSMINPTPQPREQGYDQFGNRIQYNAAKNVALGVSTSSPLDVPVNSSVVSSISYPDVLPWSGHTQITQLAVLTVLPEPPPEGSFRPTFIGDGEKKVLWNKSDLDYTVLANLEPTASAPSFESVLNYDQKGDNRTGMRRPWVDYLGEWSSNNLFPVTYGQFQSTAHSDAFLLLNSNYPKTTKEELLIHCVQGGIDLYHTVLESSQALWYSDGGNGTGRMASILLAGKVLGSDAMQDIVAQKSDSWFQETCGTFYVPHSYVGTKGYTSAHVGLPEWGIRHCYRPNLDDASPTASYRQCCNARWWFGEMMALLAMGLRDKVAHYAYFDYVDRYRQEHLLSGVPQPNAWHREMYDEHRQSFPPVWEA